MITRYGQGAEVIRTHRDLVVSIIARSEKLESRTEKGSISWAIGLNPLNGLSGPVLIERATGV